MNLRKIPYENPDDFSWNCKIFLSMLSAFIFFFFGGGWQLCDLSQCCIHDHVFSFYRNEIESNEGFLFLFIFLFSFCSSSILLKKKKCQFCFFRFFFYNKIAVKLEVEWKHWRNALSVFCTWCKNLAKIFRKSWLIFIQKKKKKALEAGSWALVALREPFGPTLIGQILH